MAESDGLYRESKRQRKVVSYAEPTETDIFREPPIPVAGAAGEASASSAAARDADADAEMEDVDGADADDAADTDAIEADDEDFVPGGVGASTPAIEVDYDALYGPEKPPLPPTSIPYLRLVARVKLAMKEHNFLHKEVCAALMFHQGHFSAWTRKVGMKESRKELYSRAVALWLEQPETFVIDDPRLVESYEGNFVTPDQRAKPDRVVKKQREAIEWTSLRL